MNSIEYDLNDPQIVSVIDDLPLWSAPFGMKLLDVVELRKNINVLDIGSGNGFPIIELSQRLGNTCKVYGIDPWQAASNRIREKIRLWGIQNVEIMEGRAEELPFESNYFDLVVSNNGINNVNDDKKVLSEIARTCKDGAQMVVTLNLPDTMKEFYDLYERILKEKGMHNEIKKLKEHILSKRKPLPYTLDLITDSGFEVLDVFEDSFNLCYTDGTTMQNNFVIKLSFIPGWKEVLEISDVDNIFRLLESELNRLAKVKGKISLTIPWVCINSKRKTSSL